MLRRYLEITGKCIGEKREDSRDGLEELSSDSLNVDGGGNR
jgi:hypothetical protein